MKKERNVNVFKRNKEYLVILLIKLLVIGLLLTADLLSKSFFQQRAEVTTQPITVIENVFSFIYAENTGAAFSMFSNSTTILTILSVVFIALFFVYDYFVRSKNVWYLNSFVLIGAGAIGNGVDRLVYGFVRDFISLDFIKFGSYTFPIFNLADTFLTIGVIMYIVYVIFYYGKPKDKKILQVKAKIE